MSDWILIVEDEEDLAQALAYNLEKEGYRVRTAGTGSEALQLAFSARPPVLVLLDLMLPDVSGTEICRRLREHASTRDVAVVMLTAKGEEIDRVVGFEVGADDYVVKPFSVRELVLRLKAVLRRSRAGGEETAEVAELSFGELRVDVPAHRVWVGEREVKLTALEFKLLVTLLRRKGRVQSRDRLLSDVWGIDADITTRTVDTHVKRLREKLGDAGALVETLRGVGYRFRDRPERAGP